MEKKIVSGYYDLLSLAKLKGFRTVELMKTKYRVLEGYDWVNDKTFYNVEALPEN